MENCPKPDPRIGTINHAIFVETSTNPDCPIVRDILSKAIQMGDIEFAYEIAKESLSPKKDSPNRLANFLSSLFH